MATVWAALGELMVLVGDLLALVAAGAGALAVVGEQRGWSAHTLRQIWANGVAAVVLGAAGLAAKTTTSALIGDTNGYLFALDNSAVGMLLLAGGGLLALAYWLRGRQREP